MQHPEPVSGGLVTSRDPSLLQPGELQDAQNVMLKPASVALTKVPGRRTFGSLAVEGLAYCAFDGAVDRLAAVSGGNYNSAPAGETGTFSVIGTGAGPSLAAVPLENRVALLSGGTNKVMLSDGTLRPLGINPVMSPPDVSEVGAGGAGLLVGFYEYWTTEVYIAGGEEIEGTFSGTPAHVEVTATTSVVTVSKPPTVDTNATHWRVYRSEMMANEDDTAFPVGLRVATLAIDTLSYSDGVAVVSAATYCTAFTNGNPLDVSYHTPAPGTWTAGSGNLVTDLGSDNNVDATSPTLYRDTTSSYRSSFVKLGLFGFNLNDPIVDISITFEAYRSGNAGIQIFLSADNGASWTSVGYGALITTSRAAYTVHGLWGRSWSAAEMRDGNFLVGVFTYCNSSSPPATGTVALDYLNVTVTTGGEAPTESFPIVVLDVGPVTGSFGRNGLPPSSNTGDIFQGSLLMNDVNNPRVTRYTVPGYIDYSPEIYSYAWPWPVKHVASLGSVAVVAQTGRVDRFNYLPLESDGEFVGGRAVDVVDSDDGCVGHHAACKFTMGGSQWLFYVGQTSLRMTNGFSAHTATDDIIWPDMVDQLTISRCHVVNNARYHEILVFYPSVSGDRKTLRLSYSPSHLKDGKLKVVSICDYGPTSSTYGINDNSERVVYTVSSGVVYIENRGTTSDDGSAIVPSITTREMHLGGLGSAWELVNLAMHHGACAGELHSSYTSTQANYPARTGPLHSIEAPDRGLSIVNGGAGGEGISITVSGDDIAGDWILNYLVLFHTGLGPTITLN